MPAPLRPTPITISSTKSVRACGNTTPSSTTLGCLCSRASTSLRKASGLAIFLPLMSDATTSTISRIAFAGFRARNRRITCCSVSRFASAIGMGPERFIGLCGKRSYPVKEQIMATQDTAIAPKEERTVSLQRSLYDPGYVNAMSHFYRGELGRIMVWRQRLDITTNWAITSSTAIITFAFSSREVPHSIFFFNLALAAVMLWVVARRYRFYDAFRARVRMLEAHFLVPMVMENRDLLQGEWKKLVCEDLILPSFKISAFEAVGRRLKRNYVFIFLLIIIAWVTKIFLHATTPMNSF